MTIIHGSAFAYQGFGCLLRGPSGSGKTRLVADAMGLGAKLIADDQVVLSPLMGLVSAAPAQGLLGVMELRGMGLIKLPDTPTKHVIHVVIDLTAPADQRLAEKKTTQLLDIAVTHFEMPPVPYTSAQSLLLYLKAMQEGRALPTDWRPQA